jgi:hypothetical protein
LSKLPQGPDFIASLNNNAIPSHRFYSQGNAFKVKHIQESKRNVFGQISFFHILMAFDDGVYHSESSI